MKTLGNRSAPGHWPKLGGGQIAALKAVVLAGPDPAVAKVEQWRVIYPSRLIEDRWGVRRNEIGTLKIAAIR